MPHLFVCVRVFVYARFNYGEIPEGNRVLLTISSQRTIQSKRRHAQQKDTLRYIQAIEKIKEVNNFLSI